MTSSLSSGSTSGSLNSLVDSFRALGAGKLAAMGLVSIGMLCMLAILVFHGGGDFDSAQMAVLYSELDLREAGQMADVLDKAHIKHQVSAQGDTIMVSTADAPAARLLLAKSSLPSAGSIGYEIFDRGDGLTSTQFQQEISQSRALEGELVRSIALIHGVRGARVHLVLPHRDLFAQDPQPAQASVLLTMRSSSRLAPEAVQAILNLVSAAVPGLKPEAIAIIDNHGNVLARNGSSVQNASNAFSDMRQAMEVRLSQQVEDILAASLGPGKVRAEASVTLDEASIDQTQETYNPEQQVLRSQQTSSDKSRNTEAQQSTTVANNLPNADAGRAQSGSQDDRREETNNYEIGRTVTTTRRVTPVIQRISLAVLVDDEVTIGRDGKPVWHARDTKELARLTKLVQSTVGFDAKRGDTVTVDSMRFDDADELGGSGPEPTLLGLGLPEADLVRLAQTIFIGLITLSAGLFVFRPMIMRLGQVGRASSAELASVGASEGLALLSVGPNTGDRLLLPGPSGLATDPRSLAIASQSLIGKNEISQVRTVSTRRLTELVEQFPDESLTLVRAWLSEGIT